MGAIFRRKIYTEMLDWKENTSGRRALLIEGARRVGKTTVAEEFARNEFDSYLMINFDRPAAGTVEIFERYRSDSTALFRELQQLYGVRLVKGRSVVVFDEIQSYPRARELIKFLVAEGDYRYIETGSLISIRRNVRNITVPSEEHRIEMHPMDFEEFLWALGDETTMPYMREAFSQRRPAGRAVHEATMEKFRTYLLVGGMPQAVAVYLETGNLSEVEKEKQGTIDLYREDMHKIVRGSGIHAAAMFEAIPTMLSRHSKAVAPGPVGAGGRMSDLETSMDWLTEARICVKCTMSADPDPAMNLSLGRERYKCYLLDTGLLLTLAFDRRSLSREQVQRDFLRGRLSMNEGMIFENAVAQMLSSAGSALYFHEFYDDDRKHLYEVDFLVPGAGRATPVEVKSSNSSSHRSLDLFVSKHGKAAGPPAVIHAKDLRVDGGTTYIPVYMTPFLVDPGLRSGRRLGAAKPRPPRSSPRRRRRIICFAYFSMEFHVILHVFPRNFI